MTKFFYLAFYKNQLAYLVFILLLALRGIQIAALGEGVSHNPFGVYSYCNASNTAAFLLTPLMIMCIIRPASLMAEPYFAAGSGSRQYAALRCLAVSGIIGFSFSLAINVSAAVVALVSTGRMLSWDFVVVSIMLHAMVCTVIALIYLYVLLLSGQGVFAFMASLLFGLWDFMAQNVVGGGVPSIAWGRASLVANFQTSDLLFPISFLTLILAILFFGVLVTFYKKDYVVDVDRS